MPGHLSAHAVGITEVAQVPELVELVRADRLDARVPLVPGQVVGRTTEEGHARTGEGDLGGRGEYVGAVWIARGRRQSQHVHRLGRRLLQGVYRVSVVPEDAEVGCRGRHRHQRLAHLGAVGGPGGVGVRRYAPHALDLWICCHEFGTHRNVGAVRVHRHGDHLDAVGLGYRKMPVIARGRAQELDRALPPGCLRVRRAVQQTEDDQIVHVFEAGVAAREQIVGRDPQQFTENGTKLGQSGETAVVAAVGALAVAVDIGSRQRQQIRGEVELFR